MAVIDKAVDEVRLAGGTIGHRYNSVLLGFSATLPDGLLTVLEANDAVEYIEKDGTVKIC